MQRDLSQRDRILDTALAVFETQGVPHGMLGAIAGRAGVGRADDAQEPRAGLLTAFTHLRSHRLLQRVLRDEPEEILPALTVRAASCSRPRPTTPHLRAAGAGGASTGAC